MGQIVQDVDDHNRPVNNTLDIIGELVETGADVLSASELNQLQTEGKKLKERYDFVSDNSDKLLKRMSSSKEELAKFIKVSLCVELITQISMQLLLVLNLFTQDFFPIHFQRLLLLPFL